MSDCNAVPAGKDKSSIVNTDNNDLIRIPSTKHLSTNVNVAVNIQPGTASPVQTQAWKRFWQKMIVEVKKETGDISTPDKPSAR